MSKICPKCNQNIPDEGFHKSSRTKSGLRCYCKICERNIAKQRISNLSEEEKRLRRKKTMEYRRKTNNTSSHKYEKTRKGFLMRLYRNMKSRVSGVQRHKFHLYAGCPILSKEEFYGWALSNETFHRLFSTWEANGYDRKLTPSVDRMDSFHGYELWNMEWVTMSENSRRGSLNKHYGDWRYATS